VIDAKVRLTFIEPLLGSAPLSADIYSKYIESLKVKRADALSETESEVETLPEVDEKKGCTGFHRDAQGLFLYDYSIKGFFKEASNILKDMLGEKNLRSKLDNYLFITPRRLYLKAADGSAIKDPHGVHERPLRAMTMQGPRVSLALSEFVNAGTYLDCSLRIYDGHPFKHPERIIEACLEYGRDGKGFGQWRNAGWGRADFKLEFTKSA